VSDEPSINTRLVEEQKKILPLMYRSHRLLKLYIYYSTAIIYLWMGWVVLFILWMELPPSLGIIALIVVGIPILIAPIVYRQMKRRYGYIIDAKKTLDRIQDSLNSQQAATGIFNYISLLLSIIKPDESKLKDMDKPITIRSFRINSISQIGFQILMIWLIFVNFFIPEILQLLETGGILAVLLNPVIVLMAIVLTITITGSAIFALWEFTVRKWLKIYQSFMTWGEDLERMVFSKDQDMGGTEL